jgi:hypothetical protein
MRCPANAPLRRARPVRFRFLIVVHFPIPVDTAKRNDLPAGEWVNIRCQAFDYDGHTGERLGLFDKVLRSREAVA